MVVVRSSTRVEEEGKEAAVVVPAEVQEAIAMVESDSPLVAAEGFSKLSHATFNNPTDVPLHVTIAVDLADGCLAVGKEAAGAAGAVKAIVEAMERNISNGTVQEDGCHALRNVAFHCGTIISSVIVYPPNACCCAVQSCRYDAPNAVILRLPVPNLALAREQGAIVAVLKAMEAHPENEALQAEGCWALLVFCSNTEESAEVAKAHASIVEKAVATYPTNADIQSRGRFLTVLFTGAYVG
ncbi:hypothetical protein BBJ28_00014019 [Nothophytophthora sp. Chile5]|nr:hypothetical protein BBJ28_00014019 [Nothophytophthora sp. Chile5]